MAQYKTIAGPIGLQVQSGEDYGTAVKKYAAIIDAEAVGGWELHLIQQIAVKKWIWYTVIIGAVLGAILGFVIVKNTGGGFRGPSEGAIMGGLFFGAAIGAILGCFGLRNVTEFFNMLVFVKHDGSTGIHEITSERFSSSEQFSRPIPYSTQQRITDTTYRIKQTLHDNPTALRMSVVAWIALFLFSTVQFQFGGGMFSSYFHVNIEIISILSPLILMVGTFLIIKKGRIDLMAFLLGSHLILLLANILLFGGGGFNLITISHLAMVSAMIFAYYYCSKNSGGKKYLTIASVAFSLIWCVIVMVYYQRIYGVSMESSFSLLFSAWNLRTVSFFIGTAWLGRQTLS